ncbi:CopG family transcriptional regulator [Gammaproteobacteria bacterium]|nr:CopG family transcriptional regulator [Gammaproteobacteria bacterium]
MLNTTPMAVKINIDMKERMLRLADIKNRTPHWIMREAISQYIEREEKYEVFHQSAIDSWQEYQTTGLHVSSDEVFAWLETWGTDNEKAAPLCHK